MKRASFQSEPIAGQVRCGLCPHRCRLSEGQRGICRARRVVDGVLRAETYGRLDALAIDPIEKKPLYHFHPGEETLSLATVGCNFRCSFCQNHGLSQSAPGAREARAMSVAQVLDLAAEHDLRVITFTYSEPTVFFETMFDVAAAAIEAGLETAMVSNGFIEPEPLSSLIPRLRAANIDLKFPDEARYRRWTGGSLYPVRRTIEALWRAGVWVEVTTLVIPDANDAPEDLAVMARAIVDISPRIPWHVSAFHPAYRVTDRARTPSRTLLEAREIGLREGLEQVFIGNLGDGRGGDTRCPGCGDTVIERVGFMVKSNRLDRGRCPRCDASIAGVWGG